MSRRAFEEHPPSTRGPVRNDGAVVAQLLRCNGAVAAQPVTKKPCGNDDGGFDGPWHRGCGRFRGKGKGLGDAEDFAAVAANASAARSTPNRPTPSEADPNPHSNPNPNPHPNPQIA